MNYKTIVSKTQKTSVRIRNRVTTFFLILCVFIVSFTTTVFAQSGEIKNPLGDLMSLTGLLNRFLSFLIPIAVVGFTLCILYATYIRLFAGGDSGKEKMGFTIARNAAIGFFIIFMAGIVLQLFGGVLKIDI